MYIKNPLDNFQSYSVQYIMLACRTTVSASAFTDESLADSTLASINNVKALGDPVIHGNSSNDVFLVIDTRRFAQFTVESMKYDVYINGLQTGGSTSNLAADLSMVVLDSVGISFANFLQWLMDSQMKTNFDGLVFMIRTVFVGHHPDGSTEVVQSETIPMHLNRVEINLDYAKGAYTLEFMPNMNFSVSKFNRFMSVSTATKYKTGEGNTLGGLIQNFEDELNAISLKHYRAVQEVIGPVKGLKDKEKFGRLVTYQITTPDRWRDFSMKGPSSGKTSESVQKTDGEIVPPAVISNSVVTTQPGSEITKILDEIFRQVVEVSEMGNFQSNDPSKVGFITFYKHIVGLTSSEETMCVHVDVVEFKVPNIFPSKTPNAAPPIDKEYYKEIVDESTGIKRVEPLNFLQYDYIFSGRNKDILNFEMKIQDFQFLLASNLKIGTSDINKTANASGELKEDENKQAGLDLMYARKFDPIMIPNDSAAALQAFSNISGALGKKDEEATKKSQQYTKNLAMFYAGSPIVVTMTIKGNPLIMHKVNIGKFQGHPAGTGQSSADGSSTAIVPRDKYREDLETRILKANSGKIAKDANGTLTLSGSNLTEQSYATAPVFIRVKVNGPVVNFRTNEEAAPPYAESVLGDQYYVMFRISNIFQGHLFTQELELYSHNIFGASGTDKIKKP